MHWIKIASFLLLASRLGFSCSCVNSGSVCGSFSGTEVVFLERVVQDSGEGYGATPGHMIVEEALHGLPKDLREVDVDTMAGTSCYMRLATDDRMHHHEYFLGRQSWRSASIGSMRVARRAGM